MWPAMSRSGAPGRGTRPAARPSPARAARAGAPPRLGARCGAVASSAGRARGGREAGAGGGASPSGRGGAASPSQAEGSGDAGLAEELLAVARSG